MTWRGVRPSMPDVDEDDLFDLPDTIPCRTCDDAPVLCDECDGDRARDAALDR